jgi:hypothetical protein
VSGRRENGTRGNESNFASTASAKGHARTGGYAWSLSPQARAWGAVARHTATLTETSSTHVERIHRRSKAHFCDPRSEAFTPKSVARPATVRSVPIHAIGMDWLAPCELTLSTVILLIS